MNSTEQKPQPINAETCARCKALQDRLAYLKSIGRENDRGEVGYRFSIKGQQHFHLPAA